MFQTHRQISSINFIIETYVYVFLVKMYLNLDLIRNIKRYFKTYQ
jgi:hypothetical protein